ncbi:nuclear transport factor 2 family protein [Paenibacillus glycanilyticus]|uniref:nuclear transport factor 2 family protein n=1 Tax=Paenibacillus glycanilyticus TaxID=126569 RepID=UPI00203A72F5|nr:nuclear transport factor 2 family protein [Paenibacillus glycanilyticus]MCM3628358.1 nuclear transport factor 2 family protein [Paenibacillus glycanilyticus]
MIRLPESVHAYFAASNEAKPEAFLAAFDDNAYVQDNGRAISGIKAIAGWIKAEVFDVHVQFKIIDIAKKDGTYHVIASVDGDFDKTNLPAPLLMKHSFQLSDGKIKELSISLL